MQIYTPFFPGGTEQVNWQLQLQRKHPFLHFYPYPANVSKNEMLYVVFESELEITAENREEIIRQMMAGYGVNRDRYEKMVPSVEQLKEWYKAELKARKHGD
jgi:hypothetical protein